MRVALYGNRGFSRQVLSHLLEDWDVVGVVGANPDEDAVQTGFVPIHEVAEDAGVPGIGVDDVNDHEVTSFLESVEPDVAVCAGWTQIIDEELLGIPADGTWGLHASDLPQGRGGAPVNWSIIHGEPAVTMSLFEFVPEVDDGDVLGQRSVPVEDRDTVGTVYDRLTVASFDLLDDALERLEAGGLNPVSQNRAEATYRPNRTPDDGWMDWRASARDQYNFVRALTDPYPGAFTFFDSDRLTVWDAEPRGEACADAASGEVIRVIDGAGVDVCTGGEVLRLRRVQLGDRPRLWADEFADRLNVTPGRVLGRTDDVPEDWFYTGIRDADGGTRYDTNLQPGETGVIQAVVASPTTPREFHVEATLGGRTLIETTHRVHGEEFVAVRFETAETGIHTLKVAFDRGGDRMDTRYLKVFVTE